MLNTEEGCEVYNEFQKGDDIRTSSLPQSVYLSTWHKFPNSFNVFNFIIIVSWKKRGPISFNYWIIKCIIVLIIKYYFIFQLKILFILYIYLTFKILMILTKLFGYNNQNYWFNQKLKKIFCFIKIKKNIKKY